MTLREASRDAHGYVLGGDGRPERQLPESELDELLVRATTCDLSLGAVLYELYAYRRWDPFGERAKLYQRHNPNPMPEAIVAFLRQSFLNDGAEGESVWQACAIIEELQAKLRDYTGASAVPFVWAPDPAIVRPAKRLLGIDDPESLQGRSLDAMEDGNMVYVAETDRWYGLMLFSRTEPDNVRVIATSRGPDAPGRWGRIGCGSEH